MGKAIVYVLYHPSSFSKYAYMRRIYAKEYLPILIICKHPYLNQDIIKCCVEDFDHVVILQDIQYEVNLFRLAIKVIRFLKAFHLQIKPILKKIKGFHVISNASSYLPVNIILSRLRRNRKCGYSISIADELDYKADIDFVKSGYTLLVSLILKVYPIYYNRKLGFMYIKYPIDRILRFNSPFLQKSSYLRSQIRSMPVYDVIEPLGKRAESNKDIIIIYGDMTVYDGFGSDLSYEAYEEKMTLFFSFLSKYYNGFELIYKPHPLDNGKIMPALSKIKVKVYKGGLTSQLHLDMHIDRVKACYSVASTSLRYSASKGIPSYTCYKYLEFNNDYPKYFFENKDMFESLFLYNIENIDDIGRIDNLKIQPAESNCIDDWHKVMR